MTTALAEAPAAPAATYEALPVSAIADMVHRVHELQQKVMRPGIHYGVIPGTGTAEKPAKPTLLQPGAQILLVAFRLRAESEIIREILDPEHIHYTIRANLTHINSGLLYATGLACCSSWERKYRYRTGARKCPKCGQAAIIKGKEEYGGGWLCFQKKGGCGAKWLSGAGEIESQAVGETLNPDPHDQANTILKIGCKRALIAATLNATAASDVFTQDLEENELERLEHATMPEAAANGSGAKSVTPAPQAAPAQPAPAQPQAAPAQPATPARAEPSGVLVGLLPADLLAELWAVQSGEPARKEALNRAYAALIVRADKALVRRSMEFHLPKGAMPTGGQARWWLEALAEQIGQEAPF